MSNTTIDLDIEFKDVGRLKTPFVRLDNHLLKMRGDPYVDGYDLQPMNESLYVNPISSNITLRLDFKRINDEIYANYTS